jgi:hypothetical protein
MIVTCDTPDCENRGAEINVPEPEPDELPTWVVVCGPCGATLHQGPAVVGR